jgi:hypothetical protein
MVWIYRPTVHIDCIRISTRFYMFLAAVVMLGTQGLQWSMPKQVSVTSMWSDVVCHRGGSHSAFLQAQFT